MNIKVAGIPCVYHHDHVKIVQKKLDFKANRKIDNESTEQQLTPIKHDESHSREPHSQPILTELEKVAHQISAIQAVELKSREKLLLSRYKSQKL